MAKKQHIDFNQKRQPIRCYVWEVTSGKGKDKQRTGETVPMLEVFQQDSGYAQRPLGKGPGFWREFNRLAQEMGGWQTFGEMVAEYLSSKPVAEYESKRDAA